MTSILVTAVTYFVFYQFNEWLFASFELHSGANWIYLPAGLRLLCTLLLGIEGAIGIFIAALAISLSNLAHIDFTTMLVHPLFLRPCHIWLIELPYILECHSHWKIFQ